MMRILITGANGFLGRTLVRHARDAGASVVAVTRGNGDPEWDKDSEISQFSVDLGAADAVAKLSDVMSNVDAVIHAAASFTGDAAAHARDTIGATDHVLQAMKAAPTPPKMVLVSSMSVYDVAAMQDHAQLDENGPLLQDASQRDAYAAAKVAQENLTTASGLPHQILRAGAIYGPHRLWSAQLGFAKFGRVFCPGGDSAVPAISVDHTAAGLVAACAQGRVGEVINLVDPNPPTQVEWLTQLGLRTITVPRGLVLLAGRLLGRGPAWQARFRPLKYDTKQAETLNITRISFGDAVKAAKQQEQS